MMHIHDCPTSQLNNDQLTKIQSLEQQLGLVLVAVDPEPKLASLNAEEMKMLQQFEKRTGKILLAYEGH
jgi:hypothetical protein